MHTSSIYHSKVTPYWPQANATVERFNRIVKKAIRTAHVEGRDWRKALDTFLLKYRATPHAMTGVSPAKIMFGHDIRTKVPEISKSNKSETQSNQSSNPIQSKRHGSSVLLQRGNEPAIMRNVSLTMKIENDGVEQFTESSESPTKRTRLKGNQ
jgi:hypothetical protein